MAPSNIKQSTGDIIFKIITYFVFTIITLICIYPFYYVMINTISANNLSASGEIVFLPKQIHFNNYLDVLKLQGLGNAALISVMRTIIGAAGTVCASAFLGFLFSQEKMIFRKALYRIIVVTMYFNAGLIPWYITMMNLGLTNNFWGYVLPAIVQPFNIILVKTYVESTPYSLQEAAKIDGANPFQIFMKVILPLITPILATIAIFAAVGQWNSFTDTLVLMTEQKLYTLQFMLYQYINQANSLAAIMRASGMDTSAVSSLATQQTPTSIRMTVTVIVVLPILCVYPYFQKYFVKGIMVGAVKG